MKPLVITTSWDDGHALDMKLAELLHRYGLTGTFYISKDYQQPRLTDAQIKELVQTFEVGAHTITHRELTTLAPDVARAEIMDSKHWLEQIIGRLVSSFCYPRGDYNSAVRDMVKIAGFSLARTVEAFKLSYQDPFEMGTTLHVYPFPMRMRNAHCPKFYGGIFGFQINRFRAMRDFGVPFTQRWSWLSTAKAMFDIAQTKGGIFHLWGHSWEIEKYGLWPDLEKFFEYLKNKGIRCITNQNTVTSEINY